MKHPRYLFFTCLFILYAFSCSNQYGKYLSRYHFQHPSDQPDYSNLDYWAANPHKKSTADSVPVPLQPFFAKDTGVDVFFLHPTTFGTGEGGPWNADINDSLVNAKTDYSTILYQASCFNECRLFAPRYRQANLLAYYTRDTTNALKAFDLAYEDIKRAFLYYLQYENQGRPIIIASHSQGTTHAKRLLREFFDGKSLRNQLVAAYIIGMAIPKDYFSALPACTDSAQTGCFVGWRTYRVKYEPPFVQQENGTSWAINPLTWSNVEGYAPKSLNQGGLLTKFNTLYPHLADAQVHDGVLWTHKPVFPGSFFYFSRNYHIGDINLFYMNIRSNIKTRIRAYRQNH